VVLWAAGPACALDWGAVLPPLPLPPLPFSQPAASPEASLRGLQRIAGSLRAAAATAAPPLADPAAAVRVEPETAAATAAAATDTAAATAAAAAAAAPSMRVVSATALRADGKALNAAAQVMTRNHVAMRA
jgi:hypothetical protein